MDESARDRAIELLYASEDLEHGQTQVAMTEEAVSLADACGELELSFLARKMLVSACIFGGYPGKALVAFSWLLGQSDKDPERFPDMDVSASLDILWMYKWIARQTPLFPQIERAQIEHTLKEMEARYRRNGQSLRPVWAQSYDVSMLLGDGPDVASAHFDQWRSAERDDYADCRACEISFEVTHWLNLGMVDAALETAAPLLQGRSRCAEVPHHTYARLLVPTWQAGRVDDAREFHRRGYDLLRRNRDFAEQVIEHVDYNAIIGRTDRAVTLFERHVPWALDTRVTHVTWRWMATGGPLFRLVSKTRDTVKLRMPRDWEAFDPGGKYSPAELASWFERRAEELSAQFDARNKNAWVSRRARQIAERVAG